MDFSKIREMRKQNKREMSRTSIGNEEDLISSNKAKLDKTPPPPPSAPHHHFSQDQHSPNNKRSLLSCFNCCVKA
ncbi:hypothetical protein OSB04_027609 [Centaurea solstitialis]|uniref:Uncharacterized protein n=1 Tax=Centaurea solstitialis TaxID=347529 RepID=A0AA38SZ39_9ASTR|nr:hypothetical protein OSB04_027609 [Centaurea solstitialis]